MTDLRLTVDSLRVERGGRLVLTDVRFAVAGGTALIVTGQNGAGKSTLLRTIAGLVPASSGSIVLESGDAERSVPEQCHYFGHQDAIKSALTVAENLAFWQSFYGGAGTVRGGRPGDSIVEALGQVGLERLMDLPAAYLSAGQRRRLSFARLLVSLRPVWLLDEPTSALDAWAEDRFVQLMNLHLGQNGIIVVATHAPIGLISKEPANAPVQLRLRTAMESVA